MAHDLHDFDQAFGLQPMRGEEAVTCAAGMAPYQRGLGTRASPARHATTSAPLP